MTTPLVVVRMRQYVLLLGLALVLGATISGAGPALSALPAGDAVAVASTWGTTLTIKRPASTAAGDVLVASVNARLSSSSSISAPAGWSLIRQDSSSLLSYTHDGDVISLDPIHAPGDRDKEAWATFLRAFNDWAHARGGVPLLNQSPFVTKQQVVDAYGSRWQTLCDWLRTVDPQRRMVNEFFGELLV